MLFSDPVAAPAETWPAPWRDYPEWHRGRQRYGVWIVPIEQADLLDWLDACRRQLHDLLHPSPQRPPHLTVFVCGFEQPRRVHDDDFTAQACERQLAALRAHASAPSALPLACVDSFASAAFVPVGDPQGLLAGWRHRLGQASREIRQSAYVPHITLGLYRKRVEAAALRQRLQALPAPSVALQVKRLIYATYVARQHMGPLRAQHIVSMQASALVAAP